MVSFIPDDVTHADFCDTMDRIQRHLKVHRINNYYYDQEFAAKFSPGGPAGWADDGLSYPEEYHHTFLLRLGGKLPLCVTGHPSESKRPIVFTLPISPVLRKPGRTDGWSSDPSPRTSPPSICGPLWQRGVASGSTQVWATRQQLCN